MNKSFLSLIAVATMATAGSANAATTVFTLKDLNTSANYADTNIGQTFSGTGFVGVYSGNQFAHLFGLEGASSRTTAQVDLSSILGKTITSAVLSYAITSNSNKNGVVTITGSSGDGRLGYSFAAPTVNYGTALGTTLAANSANVTNLVTAALASNNPWLDLFFVDSVAGNWSYTNRVGGGTVDADSAKVRLTVTYADAITAVPEPASWAMMIVGVGAIGFSLRRRAKVSTAVKFA